MQRTETATTKVFVDGKDAEASLADLKKEAAGLRKELRLAKDSGDKEAFLGLSKRLDENKRKMNELKNSTFVYDNVVKNLSKSSLKDLERAQKSISKELSTMTRNTAEFVEKSKLLSKVRAEISSTRAEMNQFSVAKKSAFNFSGAVDGFNKYFGVIAGGFAAITGVVMSFRSTVDDYNVFEQKSAELSSLTELVGDDLEYLKSQAKELSVSTTESGVRITASASDILEAFKLMGGAKAELLENKEALAAVTREALILAETSELTAQEAVEALANTMNQFSADADQASRYINVLAAGATAGSAEVDDLSASMVKAGTAANMSNISVEETVALLETLAEKGVKAEIAGTQLKSVILKLNAGADEFNPKVVGMKQALDNLAAANLNTEERVKMFGLESVTAASILIDNRDKFAELTTAVTGTSSAYEQAAKNTDTNTAALRQAQNMVKLNSIELGERLAPHLTFSTNLFAKLVAQIVKFVNWTERNREGLALLGKSIMVLVTAVGSYYAMMKSVTVYERVSLMLTKGRKAATSALAMAKHLLAGNTQKAAAAQVQFNAAANMNPYVALASVLMAAASAFVIFSDSTEEATEKQEDLANQIDEVNQLLQEQKFLMTETEDVVAKILTGGIIDYSKYSLNELESMISDIKDKITSANLEDYRFNFSGGGDNMNPFGSQDDDAAKQSMQEEIDLLNKSIGLIERQIALKRASIMGSKSVSDEEKKTLERNLKELENWEKKVYSSILATESATRSANERELEDIKNKYNEQILYAEEMANNDLAHADRWRATHDELIIQRDAELQVKREAQEKAFLEKMDSVRKSLGLKTEQEILDEKLEDLKSNLEDKLISEAEYESLVAKLKEEFRLAQLEKENEFMRLAQQARDKWLGVSREQEMHREIQALISDYEKKLLTTEEYERALFLIKKKYSDLDSKETLDSQKKKIDSFVNYSNQVNALIGAVGEYFAAQKNEEVLAAGDSEARKKQIAKKYADTEMGIKIAQIVTSTAASVMQSFAQLGPIAGAIAAAGMGIVGGVQIATAVKERNRIKGFRKGFYPVSDENGRNYSARMSTNTSTSLVDRPTVFLAGEDGSAFPEMIIDGPTFKNLQLNAPEAIDAIYRNKTGNYNPSPSDSQSSSDSSANSSEGDHFSAAINRLVKLLDRGVHAKVYKREIDDLYNESDRVDENFS